MNLYRPYLCIDLYISLALLHETQPIETWIRPWPTDRILTIWYVHRSFAFSKHIWSGINVGRYPPIKLPRDQTPDRTLSRGSSTRRLVSHFLPIAYEPDRLSPESSMRSRGLPTPHSGLVGEDKRKRTLQNITHSKPNQGYLSGSSMTYLLLLSSINCRCLRVLKVADFYTSTKTVVLIVVALLLLSEAIMAMTIQ